MEITGTIISGIYKGLKKIYGHELALALSCEINSHHLIPNEVIIVPVTHLPGITQVRLRAQRLDNGEGYKVSWV